MGRYLPARCIPAIIVYVPGRRKADESQHRVIMASGSGKPLPATLPNLRFQLGIHRERHFEDTFEGDFSKALYIQRGSQTSQVKALDAVYGFVELPLERLPIRRVFRSLKQQVHRPIELLASSFFVSGLIKALSLLECVVSS
jgi:hypothetical protein